MESNGGYLQTGPNPGLGCACSGPSMGGIADVTTFISQMSTPVKIAGVVGLFLLYKKMSKKR